MSNPCPTFDCPCDSNPLTGYSSEVADVIVPLATAYVQLEPPLGTEYCARGCVAFASPVMPPFGSSGGGGGAPPAPVFFSTPQSCTVTCPDGTPLEFIVTAGAFTGPTQAAADAAALAYACAQANARLLCLGTLSPTVFTQNSPYSGSITASGAGLGATNTWTLAGTLPTGLTFNGGVIAGNTVTITGTPTQSGTFSFQVTCTSPTSNSDTKTFTMSVFNIADGSPLPAHFGCAPFVGIECDPTSGPSLCVPQNFGDTHCGIFSAQMPTPPYVWATGINNHFNNGFVEQQWLNITTSTAVVWNYQLSATGCVPTTSDPTNLYTNLFLPFVCPAGTGGTNPVVPANGIVSLTGQFTTQPGVPFNIMFLWTPQASGSILFQLQPNS